MLAGDHGGRVLAEQQLAAGGMLRRDNVDGLVGVHVGVAGLGQLTGHAGTDDFSAVQTEDGVHDGRRLVGADQLCGGSTGLRQAELGQRDVDVIVDMAMAGSIVPLADAQLQVRFAGGQFNKIHRHGGVLPSGALPVSRAHYTPAPAGFEEQINDSNSSVYPMGNVMSGRT